MKYDCPWFNFPIDSRLQILNVSYLSCQAEKVIKLKTPILVRSAQNGDISALLYMILQHKTLLNNSIKYYYTGRCYFIVIDNG